MTPDIAKKEVEFVAILIVAILIFVAGWMVEGWRKDAQIADLKRAAAAVQVTAMTAAATELRLAVARGDALAGKVSAMENERNSLALESQHEIHRLTRGQPCLNSAVVGVLNRPMRPDRDREKAASQPVSTAAAPAADPVDNGASFATDTDVAIWAAACRHGYETCRGRLQAIADFFEDHPSE